ncbi:MAG: GrpB family protein [Bacteroidota bacterium]
MKKNLKELTKHDWDTLFPIQLVDHDPTWKAVFNEEKQKILEATKHQYVTSIAHFGSSSIPNIKSKPYIDILIEIPRTYLFDPQLTQQLESIGYTCLTAPNNDPNNYMILAKGYNLEGTCEQIFHIHACPKNHPMLEQIKFRDYLIQHPERAKQYERLKVNLSREFKNDRSGYRIAKTDFIKETLNLLKQKNANGKI